METADIDNLVNLISTDVSDKDRRSINGLLIVDVSQREITSMKIGLPSLKTFASHPPKPVGVVARDCETNTFSQIYDNTNNYVVG